MTALLTQDPGATVTDDLVVVDHLTTDIDTPRGTVRPIDDVSLTVGRGETLGVVGETGSGKSLLIRSIMGLVPPGSHFGPDSRVVFDGVDLCGLTPKQLRAYWGKEIALVPQDPATSLNPVRRIGDQICDSLRFHLGMSKKEAETRAAELLDQVGIASARSRLKLYPHELSGGMRQRVLIAIAIALGPKLLVADEPTTALDVTIQNQILDLIDALKVEIGMSVIVVSHDLALVAGRSDRIAVLYGGRLVEQIDSAELTTGRRHPYTYGLLQSHPDLDSPQGADLDTIPGEPPDILHRPSGCPFSPRCERATEQCTTVTPALVDLGGARPHQVACYHPHPAGPGKHSGRTTDNEVTTA